MEGKCDRKCFECKYDDCIMDDITLTEYEMQNYRDACATVTGRIRHGHGGKKNQPRKGGRYD